jgi:aminoglycoside phosphotransferase
VPVSVQPASLTQAALEGTLADLVDRPGSRTVVVGASTNPNANVIVLLFPDGSARPDLTIKVPTTDAAAAAVEEERRVLMGLEGALPARLSATVPQVVGSVDVAGRPALVMTALPGIPMHVTYHRWRHTAGPRRVAADFRAAGTWLADFQRATRGASLPIEDDGGTSARLELRFAGDPRIDGAVRELERVTGRLRRERTPCTAVHGDFWPGNLLRSGDGVSGVIDWEAGRLSGEPVRDLVRFAVAYALYLDRHARLGRRVAGHGFRAGRWGAGVPYAVDGDGWFPRLFRRFLQEGLVRLGASPERWRDAALAGIAEVAASADDEDFARRHVGLFVQLAGAGR